MHPDKWHIFISVSNVVTYLSSTLSLKEACVVDWLVSLTGENKCNTIHRLQFAPRYITHA